MRHHVTVGKPTKKGDKVTGYKEVTEIPSNEVFHYNRRGYVTIPDADIPKAKAASEKAPKKKTSKKTAKPAGKKTAAKKDSAGGK